MDDIALPPPDPRSEDDHDRDRQRRTMAIVAVVVLLVAVIVLAVIVAKDDDEPGRVASTTTSTSTTTSEAAPSATATTSEGSTSTVPTSTTSSPSSAPAPLTADDAAFVVWPDPSGDVRFDDPVAAARGFAVDLVGFSDPIIGAFAQGDSRSGEVEVRAKANGPATTVLVRQYGEGSAWWVIGASTTDIQVAEPTARQAVDRPLQVSGRSRAFEGQVNVTVRADGGTAPLGEGFVMGSGGPELGAFTGSIPFDDPSRGWGSVVFSVLSAEDGRVWQATVVRVGFVGGD